MQKIIKIRYLFGCAILGGVVLVSFLAGILYQNRKSSHKTFRLEEVGRDINVYLRGKPIITIRDQVSHYKFWLTGENMAGGLVVLDGSIDEKGAVRLGWIGDPDNSGRPIIQWQRGEGNASIKTYQDPARAASVGGIP